MFNANNLLTLLKARPFAPFRFVLSDGGTVEVRSPEFVMLGRQFAVVGLPDPAFVADTFIDRWTTICYTHVTRAWSSCIPARRRLPGRPGRRILPPLRRFECAR